MAQHTHAAASFRVPRVFTEDADAALTGFREAGDDAEQGRLTRAVAA